ncbi:MAG: periplasmic heavy metal sensor [candidate division WOR-3 bacterium]|nr:periplasmic heavy metal sensor [candidate division WOR-3 bacterium]
MKKLITGIVISMLMLLLAVNVFAEKGSPNNKPHSDCNGYASQHMPMQQNNMEHLREILELTDSQMEKIADIRYAVEKDLIKLRNELQNENLEMRHLIDKEQLNKAQIIAKMKKMESIRDRMQDKRFEKRIKTIEVLTEEQVKEMMNMRHCMKPRMENMKQRK